MYLNFLSFDYSNKRPFYKPYFIPHFMYFIEKNCMTYVKDCGFNPLLQVSLDGLDKEKCLMMTCLRNRI